MVATDVQTVATDSTRVVGNVQERLQRENFWKRVDDKLSARYYNSLFDDDVVVVNQNKWRDRAFVGVRF